MLTTTVAIVEDVRGICKELQHIFAETPDLKCVSVCRNGRTALQLLPEQRPDVVIMDIQLPDADGVDCVARLKPQLPDTQFLMFTIHAADEQIAKAFQAGAVGYVLKSAQGPELIQAVREAVLGGAPMTREVARKVVQAFAAERPRPSADLRQLTDREKQVLELLANGASDKQLADQLRISLQTVNTHLKHIYDKLQVHSRTEAVLRFIC